MLDPPLRTDRLVLRADDANAGDVVVVCDGTVIGRVHVRTDGHVAVLDGTLDEAHRGRGLAAEALGALVDALFADGPVQRVVVAVAPDDVAAMRLVEHQGFRFEGTALGAALEDGVPADRHQFALLRADRTDWLTRPTSCTQVELIEITDANLRAVAALATHKHQERFVSPVPRSLAQFSFPPDHDGHPVVPWVRAIQADGEIVGLLLLSAVSPGEPEPYVWRLLIDRRHQRRGVGAKTFAVLADALRAEGHRGIVLGFVDGPGSPRGFYERLGFVTTGKVEDGENEARLAL